MKCSAVASVLLIGLPMLILADRDVSAQAAASSSSSSTAVKRTPWGHPDLQGIWNNATNTPLEQMTSAEQEAGRRAMASVREATEGTGAGWPELGKAAGPSLVVDPPDGKIPYTADARKAEAHAAARYGIGPYESFLDPDTGERCLTDGVTALMWQGPNGGHNRIMQSPGYVTILHEEYRDRRIIPMDGRAHGSIRQWFGDAVGRWEGSTLVVDTVNFLDKTHYEWANVWTRPSETLHLVERFTRVDADTIEYEITIEDPTTFTRPWKAVVPITRLPSETQIYEYACHEGNYAMPNLLSGARAQDKAAEEGR